MSEHAHDDDDDDDDYDDDGDDDNHDGNNDNCPLFYGNYYNGSTSGFDDFIHHLITATPG